MERTYVYEVISDLKKDGSYIPVAAFSTAEKRKAFMDQYQNGAAWSTSDVLLDPIETALADIKIRIAAGQQV